MTRTLLLIAFAIVAFSPPAFADDPPTPEQIDAAHQAYNDGKALHDKGNFVGAVEKFKQSYELSKNPLLLYNIALTMEEAGGKDLALLYYRKFMTDAPANADQRPAAAERIKVLEKELGSHEPAAPKKNLHEVKPTGTYGPADFEHHPVEEAPPGQPLDLTASVPDDSGFKVTLFYRNAGEGEFNAVPMRWRYKELIARIPAKQLTSGTLQYYLEVRDRDGTLVTRAGKSVTPNLVTIDPQAKPRFYPDLNDDTDTSRPTSSGADEDPLHPHATSDKPTVVYIAPEVTFDKHDGVFDVGSKKYNAIKWTATASAAALLGVSVVFYVRAHNAASALADDSRQCGAPPCRVFDSTYDADLESRGRSDETVFGWTLGFGLAAAAVATWYWHGDVIAPRGEELKASTKPPKSTTAWRVTPAIDPRSFGASAAVRF